jgi:hypothetical protein
MIPRWCHTRVIISVAGRAVQHGPDCEPDKGPDGQHRRRVAWRPDQRFRPPGGHRIADDRSRHFQISRSVSHWGQQC